MELAKLVVGSSTRPLQFESIPKPAFSIDTHRLFGEAQAQALPVGELGGILWASERACYQLSERGDGPRIS
eukprot:751506-Hanusia_phi.AAC.2